MWGGTILTLTNYNQKLECNQKKFLSVLKNYIAIWFCMLLEDVMYFFCWCHKHLLINLFLFGDMNNALGPWVNSLHEHIIILRIWIVCILMSKATLWDKRPNIIHWWWAKEGLQNSKWNGLFIKFFRGHKLLKNKGQWLDLATHLWPMVVGLVVRTIGVHYQIIIKYSKFHLTSFSLNSSWLMQYMKSNNRESDITQLPLGMNSSYTWSKLI